MPFGIVTTLSRPTGEPLNDPRFKDAAKKPPSRKRVPRGATGAHSNSHIRSSFALSRLAVANAFSGEFT
jgi:hypothetical protein